MDPIGLLVLQEEIVPDQPLRTRWAQTEHQVLSGHSGSSVHGGSAHMILCQTVVTPSSHRPISAEGVEPRLGVVGGLDNRNIVVGWIVHPAPDRVRLQVVARVRSTAFPASVR